MHPDTYEPLRSIEVVITDSGVLSRNYYEDNKLACWSFDCDFPDAAVPNKRASRCLDCDKSIKTGRNTGGAPCKYFTSIKVAFLGENSLYEIRLGALSLFSRDDNRMNLYKYIEHLERNREHIGNVLTEIYFVEHRDFYKMYFKPVRPLAEEELADIQQLSEAETKEINPFNKEQSMASKSHIIRGVTALYPRINQPYHWSDKQNKSVPCDATEDGASYDLSFEMSKAQAKELYGLMNEAYQAAREDNWPKKLQMRFKENDDGTYVGKSSLKAAYNGNPTTAPSQYDAKRNELDGDFMLTTGSTVNVAVEFFPYKINGGGVALRLRGVQVIKYVPYKSASPFDEEDGFSVSDAKPSNPFAEEDDDDTFEEKPKAKAKAEPDPFDDDEDEEVKEPVKRKKKNDISDDDDDDIEDIIASWGDDD